MHNRGYEQGKRCLPGNLPTVVIGMSRFSCPTCAAVYGVMRAARIPKPIAKKASRSRSVRALDKSVKRQAKRTAKKIGTTKASREMSRYLKEANAKARKKDGSFKKGWSQSRVMREAHRLRRMRA